MRTRSNWLGTTVNNRPNLRWSRQRSPTGCVPLPIPTAQVEIVPLSPDAEALARQYLSEGILTINMFADAQHIAMATVAKVDVLVSWNFRHVVNLPRIRQFHRVNAERRG